MYTIKLIDIDKKGFLWLLLILIISFSTVVAQDNENIKNGLDIPEFKQEPVRIPKYHLKTKRMIYTDEHLAIARKNIAQYPKAQQLKNNIVKAADQWLNWNNEDFKVLLSDARVPRLFDLNETDANSAVATIGDNGKLKSVFFSNGTYLSYRGQRFEAESVKGIVMHINAKEQQIKVRLKKIIYTELFKSAKICNGYFGQSG